jgi:hypothetical protein
MLQLLKIISHLAYRRFLKHSVSDMIFLNGKYYPIMMSINFAHNYKNFGFEIL